jgi:hypothetical protein
MLSYYLLTCSIVGTEVELLANAKWFGSYVSYMLIHTYLPGLRLYLDNFVSPQITVVPLPFELHCWGLFDPHVQGLTATALRLSLLHGVPQSDFLNTTVRHNVTVGAHFRLFQLRCGFLGYMVLLESSLHFSATTPNSTKMLHSDKRQSECSLVCVKQS